MRFQSGQQFPAPALGESHCPIPKISIRPINAFFIGFFVIVKVFFQPFDFRRTGQVTGENKIIRRIVSDKFQPVIDGIIPSVKTTDINETFQKDLFFR